MEKIKSKLRILLPLVFVVAIINIIVYIWGQTNIASSETLYSYYSNLMTLMWSFLTFLTFLSVAVLFGLKTIPGKIWLFLSLGIMFWFLGDVIWAYYELILELPSPFPSIADYAYSIGYPLLFVGIIMQVRSINIKLPKLELFVIILVQSIITVLVFILLIFPIAQEEITEDFTATQLFWSIFYPCGDLILLLGALLLISKYKGGDFSKVWLLLAIGLLIVVAADLVFSYYSWLELEAIWAYYDLLFIGYNMILVITAVYLKELIK